MHVASEQSSSSASTISSLNSQLAGKNIIKIGTLLSAACSTSNRTCFVVYIKKIERRGYNYLIGLFIIAALQSQLVNMGKPVAGPTPTGCDGVKTLGWTQSGFYTVKGNAGTKVNTVYCDFTKVQGVAGLLQCSSLLIAQSLNVFNYCYVVF